MDSSERLRASCPEPERSQWFPDSHLPCLYSVVGIFALLLRLRRVGETPTLLGDVARAYPARSPLNKVLSTAAAKKTEQAEGTEKHSGGLGDGGNIKVQISLKPPGANGRLRVITIDPKTDVGKILVGFC